MEVLGSANPPVVLSGLVLGMSYFSSLRERFRGQAQSETARVANKAVGTGEKSADL